MKFTKLETIEQFEKLKKGDCIIVKWWDNYVKHTPNSEKIMTYSIYENDKENHWVVCRYKDNHYFNYKLYLEGRSNAEGVYLVELEG